MAVERAAWPVLDARSVFGLENDTVGKKLAGKPHDRCPRSALYRRRLKELVALRSFGRSIIRCPNRNLRSI
jgi:hypothetical protein